MQRTICPIGDKQERPRGRSDFPQGAEDQNRTGDTAVFSRVLYLLSYLGASGPILPHSASVSNGKGFPSLKTTMRRSATAPDCFTAHRYQLGYLLAQTPMQGDNLSKRRRRSAFGYKKEKPQVKSVVSSTDLSLSLPAKLADGLGLKDVLLTPE